ncbi:MAG: hypothetical protein CMQ05_12770 [Gammaproteobacteria bacterium]|uniref:Uncharacterized protein n=1 Tax=OM182 bacterium MED-G24 TaxID=1986255 RepID=A0A2A5WLM3_9GAMM|nr:hypothetical protein [Gammaproteobacteria bacterium]PDH37167.1 MAG: hypothetical protein CNE99_08550 [OM182 bacterium MED-G24]RPG25234.1 MAG: hypothetical protein CBC10_008995 [Gammaproteobacteria bacterium TMED50]|tara:strand:- start:163 stop:357 length:195 start_codon:yes stop_codon:yes gene_type:complete
MPALTLSSTVCPTTSIGASIAAHVLEPLADIAGEQRFILNYEDTFGGSVNQAMSGGAPPSISRF